ncbi:recombination protein O N-terminal domain-containing protein [Patescibacteria group bacterium]|nr:recombination protein O N-terminal domain-containing protein [Patescibacteria group bacterium]
MALHYRTIGFVLKKNDIGEADRIFTVFTLDFGKVKISGKAIRKIASKLKGGIDVISLSEIEFIQGKAYKTLTD